MTMAILPKLRSLGTNHPANATTRCYTCPNNYTAKVVLLLVANNTNGNSVISIKWHDTTTNLSYNIAPTYTLSSYSFLQFNESYLILNSGDYLEITTASGSDISSTVTIEEYFDPANRE